MADIMLVYVTCPSMDVAADIAKAMVERRFAACGNVLPEGRSFFQWEGKVQDAIEATILFKTTAEQWPLLCRAVKEIHPYDVPCILAIPVADGLPAFMRWVSDEAAVIS